MKLRHINVVGKMGYVTLSPVDGRGVKAIQRLPYYCDTIYGYIVHIAMKLVLMQVNARILYVCVCIKT